MKETGLTRRTLTEIEKALIFKMATRCLRAREITATLNARFGVSNITYDAVRKYIERKGITLKKVHDAKEVVENAFSATGIIEETGGGFSELAAELKSMVIQEKAGDLPKSPLELLRYLRNVAADMAMKNRDDIPMFALLSKVVSDLSGREHDISKDIIDGDAVVEQTHVIISRIEEKNDETDNT